MIQVLTVVGTFSRSFGMFERQALAEDIEQRAISLGKGVTLPFTRDVRSRSTQAFACVSGADLGFTDKAPQAEIFEKLVALGAILLEKDDEFILASRELRPLLGGCSVLYTEPFCHNDMPVFPALHCGQRILIDPISASEEPCWSVTTRWVVGL